LTEVTKARDEAVRQLNSLIQPLEKLCSSLNTLFRPAGQLSPKIDTTPISAYIKATRESIVQFQKLFPLEDTTAVVGKVQLIPDELSKVIGDIEKAVQAIP